MVVCVILEPGANAKQCKDMDPAPHTGYYYETHIYTWDARSTCLAYRNVLNFTRRSNEIPMLSSLRLAC